MSTTKADIYPMMGDGKYYNGLLFDSVVKRIPKLTQDELADTRAHLRTGKRQFLNTLFGQGHLIEESFPKTGSLRFQVRDFVQ